MSFFSIDGPFQRYGTILFDLIVLGLLWFFISLFSLGILMPLATSALMNSIQHVLIDEDGYLMASFFSIFKKKFLKSLGLTVIGGVLFGISIFNIWSILFGHVNMPYLIGVYLILLLEVTLTMIYACALMTETDMKLKQLLKYGFLLANKHILISLAVIGSIVAVFIMTYYVNNALIILMSIAPLFWFISWLIYKKVFIHYHLEKLV